MRVRPPGSIIVEAEVADSPLVHTLRQRIPDARIFVVDRVSDACSPDPDTLEVVAFRGRFLRACPGTRNYFCCGYRIIHFGVQCPLNCTYCILQAYFNAPNLRLFGNTDDLFSEVDREISSHPEEFYRVGTGEFTDSLLWDPWTGFSGRFIPFFADRSNAVLELKTKTNFIENLEKLDHGGHTIVAWSLNAEAIRNREEPLSATLEERLAAARLCARWGYSLAFHFDPMIEFPGWRQGYTETLDRLFDAVDPSRIVWISLGAFRFMPDLKDIIRFRHPKSRIIYSEFIRGLDGKMRYFRDIRVELYSLMVDRIRRVDPDLCVYLCMEGEDIWRDAFGFSPEEKGGLPAMLDRAAVARMGLDPRFIKS